MFASIATAVDGIGARYFGEVRVLAQNDALIAQTSFYAKAISFIGAADNTGAFDWFANLRASAHIPAIAAGHGSAVFDQDGAIGSTPDCSDLAARGNPA